MITNSVKLITPDGVEYDSLADWGLAIANTDYIQTPLQFSSGIEVPGRNGLLDTTEAIFGEQHFRYRPITIEFGGLRSPELWDSVISDFRNKIEGRIIRLIFKNDSDFYWKGRCEIEAFSHMRRLGVFYLNLPKADPFKMKIAETVVDTTATPSGKILNLQNLRRPVNPTFILSDTTKIEFGEIVKNVSAGTYTFADIILYGGQSEIKLTGNGNVTISYREGSL